MNTLHPINSVFFGDIGQRCCTNQPPARITRVPIPTIAGLLLALFLLFTPAYGRSHEPPGKTEAVLKFDYVFDMETKGNPAILQDNEGFMWFGSRDGLFRWDGYELKTYPPGPGALSNGSVYGIAQDPVDPDVLWLSTRGGGLNRFDKSTETFTYYQHDPNDPQSLFANDIYPVVHDVDDPDILYICSAAGFSIFSKTRGTLATYTHDPENPQSIAETECFPVVQDNSDPRIIWMGTWGQGLEKFDRTTGTFSHFPYDPDDSNGFGAKDGVVFALTWDKDDPEILWVGTICCGLEKFDTQTGEFTHYPTSSGAPETVGTIYDDGQGALWLGGWTSDSGLTIFDKRSETFTLHKSDPGNPRSLPDDTIVTFYEDRSGRIWFAGYTGKIGKYDPYNQSFDLYRYIPDQFNSLVDNSVTTLYEDRQEKIWIGTRSGLSKYDPMEGKFTNYQYDPAVERSLDKNNVLSLFEDRSGNFWISTFYGALHKFDRRTGLVIQSYRAEQGNAADGYSVIIEDPGQPRLLWLAGRAVGLTRFDTQAEAFVHYPPNANAPEKGSSSKDLSCLIHDRDEELLWFGGWAGTGLNQFDKRTETFRHFKNDPGNPKSLRNNAIGDIYQDRRGRLWIGTVGGGLEKFDRQSETFTHFAAAHGVPADVSGILEDHEGHLWLSTNEGLVRFNVNTEIVDRRYIVSDGLQGTKFALGSRLKTRNGEMWFGGENGVNRFRPDNLTPNRHIPPIVLTSLTQGGEPIQGRSSVVARRLENIELNWQHPFFEFEYAALNFTVSQKNRYKYILEGWDTEWYEAGTERKGRYSGLSGGQYTLRITGANNDGVWNDNGVSVKITVSSPFWQTTRFQFGLGVMLLGGIVMGVTWRHRSGKIQRQRLEALVADRTKELAESNAQLMVSKEQAETANRAKNTFLANMSHELRTPLNSILGFTHILKQSKEKPEQQQEGLEIIEQSGKHLLTLIDDILDIAKVEAGKVELKPAPMDLEPFLDGVVSLVLGRAEAKGLNFNYENRCNEPISVAADATRLRQVLLNLLGNAIKFTERGAVTFIVQRLDPVANMSHQETARLRFTVMDTGIGISPKDQARIFLPFEQTGDQLKTAEGTGLGLAISRQIATLMGGRIEVQSTPGLGSKFWFETTLPILKDSAVRQPLRNQAPIGYEGPRRRILVVDDVAYNRQVLVAMLKPMGFEIYTAADGQQAVDMALAEKPDAILMDLVMPVKTGIEAMRELRRHANMRETVIISVSANVLDEDRTMSRDAGSDAFLPKPIRQRELVTVLGNLLDLQWQYDNTEAPEFSLPTATLAQLTELIRMGCIRQFRELLNELEHKESHGHPLIKQLQQLARHYEVKQIMAVLKRCGSFESSS